MNRQRDTETQILRQKHKQTRWGEETKGETDSNCILGKKLRKRKRGSLCKLNYDFEAGATMVTFLNICEQMVGDCVWKFGQFSLLNAKKFIRKVWSFDSNLLYMSRLSLKVGSNKHNCPEFGLLWPLRATAAAAAAVETKHVLICPDIICNASPPKKISRNKLETFLGPQESSKLFTTTDILRYTFFALKLLTKFVNEEREREREREKEGV